DPGLAARERAPPRTAPGHAAARRARDRAGPRDRAVPALRRAARRRDGRLTLATEGGLAGSTSTSGGQVDKHGTSHSSLSQSVRASSSGRGPDRLIPAAASGYA